MASPAFSAPTAQQRQGTHQFLLTVQTAVPSGGFIVSDWHGTITPGPDETRYDTFLWLKAEHGRLNPNEARGAVIFWSIEPNTL